MIADNTQGKIWLVQINQDKLLLEMDFKIRTPQLPIKMRTTKKLTYNHFMITTWIIPKCEKNKTLKLTTKKNSKAV